jgi:hypothetical protein
MILRVFGQDEVQTACNVVTVILLTVIAAAVKRF